MRMTFAIRRAINYFYHFLTLDFLWHRPFWAKASLPKVEEALDLNKVIHPTEAELRAKKREWRIEMISTFCPPIITGALVGFVSILISFSSTPFIIVSSVPFLGLCLFIAAYIDGDQDYNIFMSFFNLILSSAWAVGGFIGIAIGSFLHH